MTARVLVTGATGFVGAAVVRALLERGDEVRVLARPGADRKRLAGLDVEVAEGDVTRPATLVPACAAIDALFHVAGLVSYRTRDRARMEAVNVDGTRNVLAAAQAAGVRRVVHTSSVVAVGSSARPEPLDEGAPWDLSALRAGYFDTKRRAEEQALAFAARGLDVIAVNPAAVIGENDPRGNLDALVARLRAGRRAVVPAGGVDLVAVEDVAQGHLLALERGRRGERYVLGAENVTLRELARRIAAIVAETHARPGVARPLPAPVVVPAPLCRALAAAASLADRVVPLAPPFAPEVLRATGRYFWYHHGKARRELGYAPGPVDAALRANVASVCTRTRNART